MIASVELTGEVVLLHYCTLHKGILSIINNIQGFIGYNTGYQVERKRMYYSSARTLLPTTSTAGATMD